MKAIRWGGLITFIAVTALVVVAALFSGVVIKPVLESQLTEMNGARVDIDSIDIAYSPFSLEINNIQITDPAAPMVNTAQIDRVKVELSFWRLLMGQLVVDDAAIDGVRIDTPRQTSGEITETSTQASNDAEQEEAGFDIPGFDLPNIDEILAKEPLQSEILINTLNKDLADIDIQWKTTKQGLPDSNKMAAYEKRFDKIKQDSKGNTAQKLAAIKDAKALISEIKQDAALIKQAKNQFSNDIKHVNNSIKQIKAAPAKDIKNIKQKYSLDGAGAENVAKMLFGDDIASYLAMTRKWYGRVEPYLSSDEDEDEEEAEQAVERGQGIDIVFQEYDAKPDFYVERASISAELPRGKFLGEIKQISSDQSINKQPMLFKLQGVDMVGKKSETLSAEFNQVDKNNSFAQINYALTQAKIEALTISRSSQLTLDMNSALMTSVVDARLEQGELKGTAKTNFRQVDFSTGSSSMFAAAFEGVKAFAIDAAFSGAIGELSVKIDSDLDNQLGKQLKAQLAQKKKKFDAALKARINEKISGPMANIDAKKAELDAIKQRVDGLEKQLQDKQAALTKTINQQKEQKKNQLKDKLFDKLGF